MSRFFGFDSVSIRALQENISQKSSTEKNNVQLELNLDSDEMKKIMETEELKKKIN